MPQTFDALRCARCQACQVCQRTQKPKFTCKLCGEKQSITRVYASGAAAEVRLVVQNLNRARGEAEADSLYGHGGYASHEKENGRTYDEPCRATADDVWQPAQQPAQQPWRQEAERRPQREWQHWQEQLAPEREAVCDQLALGNEQPWHDECGGAAPWRSAAHSAAPASALDQEDDRYVLQLPHPGQRKRGRAGGGGGSGSLKRDRGVAAGDATTCVAAAGSAAGSAAAPARAHHGTHAPWQEPPRAAPRTAPLPPASLRPQLPSDDGLCTTAVVECAVEEEVWQD